METSSSARSRFPHERLDRVAQLITERRRISVAELVAETGRSAATVRRDLKVLTDAGLAQRTHGGALAMGERRNGEPLFLEKLRVHHDLKARIGAAAAAKVGPGQTIVLDSGTTTLAVARALAGQPLTVLAMDIKVAEAAAVGATEVHILGGRVRNGYFSVVGPATASTLNGLYCDIFFLGADAVDPRGVMTATLDEAEAKRGAIAAAARTVLVADHSKLGHKAPRLACGLADVDQMITDRGAAALLGSYRPVVASIETV